jgi:hypothetical protein
VGLLVLGVGLTLGTAAATLSSTAALVLTGNKQLKQHNYLLLTRFIA